MGIQAYLRCAGSGRIVAGRAGSKGCAKTATNDLIGADDARSTIPRGPTGVLFWVIGSKRKGLGLLGGMTRSQGARAILAAVMALAALAACAESADPPTDPSTQAAIPGTPRSESAAAASDAVALVHRYYKLRDALRRDPATSMRQLESVAIGIELSTQKKLFERERREGLRQKGTTKLAKLVIESVSLDNSDPEAGRVPTVRVDACYDVSKVDIVDKDGRSVVPKSRPNTGWIRYSVASYKYKSDPSGSWRVASSHDLKRAPCDAS